jgi:hypothetical protein
VATTRQKIAELLEGQSMSAIDLSQNLRIAEKEVYAHLPHVARSVAARGRKLVIRPARCISCGYVFENRKRFTRPGRCPRCKNTHLERPFYEII